MTLSLSYTERISRKLSIGLSHNRLWVIFALGLTYILIFSLYKFDTTKLQLVLSIGAAITSFLVILMQLASKPRLKILFPHHPRDMQRKWYVDVFNIQEPQVGFYCKKAFLRARIINLGATTANNCEAKVTVLERGQPGPLEARILHWARNIPGILAYNTREAFSTVDVGFEEALDVFQIYCPLSPEPKVQIRTYSLPPLELEIGKIYEVRINVTAVNAPMDEVNVKIDLQRLEAELESLRDLFQKARDDIITNLGSPELGPAFVDILSLDEEGLLNSLKKLQPQDRQKLKNYIARSDTVYNELVSKISNLVASCVEVNNERLRNFRTFNPT